MSEEAKSPLQDMLEDTPQDVPQDMLEDTPQDMPQDIPEETKSIPPLCPRPKLKPFRIPFKDQVTGRWMKGKMDVSIVEIDGELHISLPSCSTIMQTKACTSSTIVVKLIHENNPNFNLLNLFNLYNI